MKKTPQRKPNTVSRIFLLLVGALASSSLLLLKHLNVINLEPEAVLAPFLVIVFLTYGDKLLLLLFLVPIGFVFKPINRANSSQTLTSL